MALRIIKSETNLQRSRKSMTDDVAPLVKGRKRHVAAILNCDDQRVVDPTCLPATAKRSSRFRGVSRHRWTGRYEAHSWDKMSWNVTQKKKGKQVYLGAYDEEESAARAYDLASLKYWGTSTTTNFHKSNYETEIEIMQTVTKEEYLASLRRKSSGFSRGVSKYRGVARHHHNGRWEARIGRVYGNKYLYLGTYSTQEEAVQAYDIAAIEYRGINVVTNFDLSTYIRWFKPGTNAGIPEQEIKPDTDFPTLISPSLKREESRSPSLKRKAFSTNDLISKQETISPSSRTSPAALGFLLRSSIFKELVQKNSNVSEEDIDGENMKNMTGVISDDDYKDINCDGIEFPLSISSYA